MDDFFTSLNVFDYPGPPDEPQGICECWECGRHLYYGDIAARSCDGNIICEDCIKEKSADEILELLGIEYDAKEFYSLLGGKWEEI